MTLVAQKVQPAAITERRGHQFPFRPFLTISGARSLLPGLDEDGVVNLIDEGKLEVAFNISIGEHDRRREIRIVPACLDHYRATGGKKSLNWDWPRIVQEMLAGYALPWISGIDLRLLLNCSITQITGITQRNQLALAPGSKCRPGPKGSARIVVESVLRFLQRRRV